MNTFMANPDKIDRKWYVVDAEGCTLGRLASEEVRPEDLLQTFRVCWWYEGDNTS